jgi:hypothetical protein
LVNDGDDSDELGKLAIEDGVGEGLHEGAPNVSMDDRETLWMFAHRDESCIHGFYQSLPETGDRASYQSLASRRSSAACAARRISFIDR